MSDENKDFKPAKVSNQKVLSDIDFLKALGEKVKLKADTAPKEGAKVIRNAAFSNYVGGYTSVNFNLITAKPLYYIVEQNLKGYFKISDADFKRLKGIGKANIARFYCGKELLPNPVNV